MVSDNFTLDLGELNKIIAKESRKPAVVTKSEIETNENDFGVFTNWTIEWEVLDWETGDSLGLDYPLRSRHLMPSGEVRGRRLRSYVRNVQGFGLCGDKSLTGKPEDFLGVRCWIEEVVDTYTRRDGNEGRNVWWNPVMKFIPGEPFEHEEESGELNPPASDPTERLVQVINNKTHRAAMIAINNDDIISGDDDIMETVNDGSIFTKLEEDGVIEIINNKYILV